MVALGVSVLFSTFKWFQAEQGLFPTDYKSSSNTPAQIILASALMFIHLTFSVDKIRHVKYIALYASTTTTTVAAVNSSISLLLISFVFHIFSFFSRKRFCFFLSRWCFRRFPSITHPNSNEEPLHASFYLISYYIFTIISAFSGSTSFVWHIFVFGCFFRSYFIRNVSG